MCREQLKRSHGLRLQGQKALDELKSEFEALTKDLAGDAAASLSATSAMTHGAHWNLLPAWGPKRPLYIDSFLPC